MNIGQVAQSSGVSTKMIRHYEDIGLIKKARRSASGYRVYTENDLHILAFVRQARILGFSIEQIRELLDLWQNKRRTSRKVKELALKHIQELNDRIKELQDIQQAILQLVNNCHGDDRPECPIIDGLTNTTQQHDHTGKNRKFGLKN
jgi:Cu(I)-responsive transcriptional regulator